MRRFTTSVAVIVLAAVSAGAQTIDADVGQIGFDDGTAENSWKVTAPSASGDYFNVDFDATAAGAEIIGIIAVTNSDGTSRIRSLGIYPDNLTVDPAGNTPDLNTPLAELAPAVGQPASFCGFDTAYDLPDFTLPSSNVHVAFGFEAGDSVLWLCSDSSSTIAGRSFFTTDSYATPAIPFTVNWMMRLATPLAGAGTFLVNGSSTSVTTFETDEIAMSFWGNPGATGEGVLLGAFVGGFKSLIGGRTGAFGGTENLFHVSGQPKCGFIDADATFDMGGFWGDSMDVKPNGKEKVKLTNRVTFTVLDDPLCASNRCFGLKDDGILDGNIWKVQNPAGSADFFNVKHDNTVDPWTGNITAVELASWDFCGATQSWAVVGVYDSNMTLDPAGNTPGNVLTSVSGASATFPANAAESSYPATVYDVPDLALSSTVYHAVSQWQPGDSCVWIGSDTDGTDDGAPNDCGVIPNSTSFFTSAGYTAAPTPFTTANWMMKIDWQ